MSTEKNFPPTKRKLEKARRDGDVAKSRDLTSSLQLSVFFVVIAVFATTFAAAIRGMLADIAARERSPEEELRYLLPQSLNAIALVFIPLLLISCLGLGSEVLQVGFNFSFKNMGFKLNRLGFFQGIKRIWAGGGGATIFPLGILYEGGKPLIWMLVVAVGIFKVLEEEIADLTQVTSANSLPWKCQPPPLSRRTSHRQRQRSA